MYDLSKVKPDICIECALQVAFLSVNRVLLGLTVHIFVDFLRERLNACGMFAMVVISYPSVFDGQSLHNRVQKRHGVTQTKLKSLSCVKIAFRCPTDCLF